MNPGDFVFVKSLQQKGEVLEVRYDQKIVVRIGNFTLTCQKNDLRESASQKKKKRSEKQKTKKTLPAKRYTKEIDLHGHSVAEALRKVEDALNDAILSGITEVHVVHGIGTGKLKAAVHQYFSDSDVVRSFSLDQKNTGVTRVFLAQ